MRRRALHLDEFSANLKKLCVTNLGGVSIEVVALAWRPPAEWRVTLVIEKHFESILRAPAAMLARIYIQWCS